MTVPDQAKAYRRTGVRARVAPRFAAVLVGAAAVLATAVLATAVLATAVLTTAAPAAAQTSDAERDSVGQRPRLDYESYGLSLDPVDRGARTTGSSPVYAFTRMEVETGHDINVRRVSSGETASVFTVARPGLSLHLDGEKQQTSLTGQAAIGRYGSSSGDAYEDLQLNLRSRIEIDEDADLALNAGAGRFHIERGSDLDLGPAFGTQTYRAYEFGAQLQTLALADKPIVGTVQSTWYRFDDVDGVDRSGLDRWIGVGNARIGFAQAGEVSFFVQPGVQRVDYSQNDAGNPDSTRLDLSVGATYSGGAVSQFSGFAGVSRRSYSQSGTAAEFAALVGAKALWNATDLMTVTGDLSISNEDSTLSNASSVATTEIGLGLDYEPRDNVILGTRLRWTDYRYSGDVEDERLFKAGLDVRYLLNEYAYVGAGLRWEDQASNDPANEFQATVASLRFGAKLCCLRDFVTDDREGRTVRQGVVNGVFR
jgi:hypothetical protein